MLHDPTFWVLIAFLVFFGIVFYLKVPSKLTKSLDDRAAKIKQELDEAEKLHREAQHLFAEYQRKQRNALKEADDIVAAAKQEAERLVTAAKADLAQGLERRRVQAEAKIAQAEQLAVREVRDRAADIAIAAATAVLKQSTTGAAASAQTERAVADIRAKLH